jgi:hypothetical protein
MYLSSTQDSMPAQRGRLREREREISREEVEAGGGEKPVVRCRLTNLITDSLYQHWVVKVVAVNYT